MRGCFENAVRPFGSLLAMASVCVGLIIAPALASDGRDEHPEIIQQMCNSLGCSSGSALCAQFQLYFPSGGLGGGVHVITVDCKEPGGDGGELPSSG